MKTEKSKDNTIKSYNNKKKNKIIQLEKKLSSSPLSKKKIKNNIFTFKTDKVKDKDEFPKLLYENNKGAILSSEKRSKSPNSDYKKYLSNNKNNQEQAQIKKKLFINDLVGEDIKKPIDKIYNKNNNFIRAKSSAKSYGIIKAYSVNTNQGIIRNYNEDRVSIVINMNQPNNYIKGLKWPKISYFAIFDGHGGNKCAEYLRDNLLKFIIENKNFPSNINLSIKEAIYKADNEFLKDIAVKENKIVDCSGSCCLFLLIINNIGYIVNVGDSRCLISYNNGKIKKAVTRDHKPNYSYEKERITKNGGIIYQSQNKINIEDKNKILKGKILLGPYRVLPGRLSVSRTLGDAEAKLKIFGGNPNIIICEPDIYSFNILKEDIDYFILGCDGIFDQLNNEDIFECVSIMINNNKEKDLHKICGDIVNLILNASMERKSFDNVTCIFICFKNLLNISNNVNNDINQNKVPYNRNNSYKITLSSSKSTKNTINISLDSKNNKLNFKIDNNKSLKGKKSSKEKSEKNRITIDYPNQVKKRIISTKLSNSNIFNNHNKIKKVINNNAKFVNNKIENKYNNSLKSCYSVKYYSFTDKYNNNFNIKDENKKIKSIDICFNNKRNSSKNKRIISKSNCKEKVSKTEENERKEERKNKNYKKNKIKLNIFNKEMKNNSNKSQKNKIINYKMNDSPKNLHLNYFKNFSTKKNNIIDVKTASINLDFKKDLSKTNIKLKKNLSTIHNLKKKHILKNEF